MAKPKFPEASEEGEASPPEQPTSSPSDETARAEVGAEAAVADPQPAREDPPPAYCHVFPEGAPPTPTASPISTLNSLLGPHLTLSAGGLSPPRTLSLGPLPVPHPVPLPRSLPPEAQVQPPLAHSSVLVVAPSSAPVTPVSHFPGFAVQAAGPRATSSAPQTPDGPAAPLNSPMTPVTYFPGFAVPQQSPVDYSSSSSLISSASEATQVFVVPSSLLSSLPHALFHPALPREAQLPPEESPRPERQGAVLSEQDCPSGLPREPTREPDASDEANNAPPDDAGVILTPAERPTPTPSAEPEPARGSAASKPPATTESYTFQINPRRPKYIREYTLYGSLSKWQKRVLVISIAWTMVILLGGAVGVYFIAFQPRI